MEDENIEQAVGVPEWLTFSQASEIKEVSRQTLYQWKNQGKLQIKNSPDSGRFLIRHSQSFLDLKPENKVKRRDLLMEKIDILERENKTLQIRTKRQNTKIKNIEDSLKVLMEERETVESS